MKNRFSKKIFILLLAGILLVAAVAPATTVYAGTSSSSQYLNGWQYYAGHWYYLENGVCHTGWLQYGQNRYYFNPTTKAMVTGLQKINGCMYYFYSNGAQHHTEWLDFVTPNGVSVCGTFQTLRPHFVWGLGAMCAFWACGHRFTCSAGTAGRYFDSNGNYIGPR